MIVANDELLTDASWPGLIVRRRRGATVTGQVTVVAVSLRKRSTTFAGWLLGFISDTLVSKNAELAPSASCRVNGSKPRGCVPAAISAALATPSPSGSPAAPLAPTPLLGSRP